MPSHPELHDAAGEAHGGESGECLWGYVAVGYGAHGDGDGEGEGHEPEVERHVGDGEETVTETWGVVLYHDGEEERAEQEGEDLAHDEEELRHEVHPRVWLDKGEECRGDDSHHGVADDDVCHYPTQRPSQLLHYDGARCRCGAYEAEHGSLKDYLQAGESRIACHERQDGAEGEDEGLEHEHDDMPAVGLEVVETDFQERECQHGEDEQRLYDVGYDAVQRALCP